MFQGGGAIFPVAKRQQQRRPAGPQWRASAASRGVADWRCQRAARWRLETTDRSAYTHFRRTNGRAGGRVRQIVARRYGAFISRAPLHRLVVLRMKRLSGIAGARLRGARGLLYRGMNEGYGDEARSACRTGAGDNDEG